MRGWVLVSVLAFGFLPTAEAAAQQRIIGALEPGARVRYEERSERGLKRTGTVRRIDGDTLRVLDDEDSTVVMVLPSETLQSLDVSLGSRPTGEGAARGAVRGLVVGGVLSAVLVGVAVVADRRCSDCMIPATPIALVVGALGTGVLTGLGAMIGAAAPGEEWLPMGLPLRRRSGRD